MHRLLFLLGLILVSMSSLSCGRGSDLDENQVHGERWVGSVLLSAFSTLDFSLRVVPGARLATPPEAASARISIPTQGLLHGELHEVSTEPGTLRFVLRAAPDKSSWASFDLKTNEDGTAQGSMTQWGISFAVAARRLAAGEALPELDRPQHPKPPFPYTSRDVEYRNPNSKGKLAGTLTMPPGTGPFPAALLITGSGPQDRDETLFGHKLFWVLADHLSRNGIAVLRVDDRGVGGSTPGSPGDTSADYASDVRAGLAFLAVQPEVAKETIGLIGHSEGGLIGGIVAGSPDAQGGKAAGVSWIVMLAGPGISGRDLAIDQATSLFGTLPIGASSELSRSMTSVVDTMLTDQSPEEFEAAIRELVLTQRKALGIANGPVDDSQVASAIAQFRSPWFQYLLRHDPAQYLARIAVPVLALNGALDRQVRAEANLAAIEVALALGGNIDATVKSMPGLNHLFQEARTGGLNEYGAVRETFNAEALKEITEWIRNRTEGSK